MPLGTQILMMLTLMLTSKGVAAVPRASLVILAGTLQTFHLPEEGIAVILGVDALMDMCRTSVNLLGNCVASAVVARWEGVPIVKEGVEVEMLADPGQDQESFTNPAIASVSPEVSELL